MVNSYLVSFALRVFVVVSVIFIGWTMVNAVLYELNLPIVQPVSGEYKPAFKVSDVKQKNVYQKYVFFPHIQIRFPSRYSQKKGVIPSKTECGMLQDKCYGFDTDSRLFLKDDMYHSELVPNSNTGFYVKADNPQRYNLASELCKSLGSTISLKTNRCSYTNSLGGDSTINSTFEDNLKHVNFSKLIDANINVIE